MMKRRSFFKFLAAVPFIPLLPKPVEAKPDIGDAMAKMMRSALDIEFQERHAPLTRWAETFDAAIKAQGELLIDLIPRIYSSDVIGKKLKMINSGGPAKSI